MGKLVEIELKSKLEMVKETIARVQKRIDDGEPVFSILILTESDDPGDKECCLLRDEHSAEMKVRDELWLLEKAKHRLMRVTNAGVA